MHPFSSCNSLQQDFCPICHSSPEQTALLTLLWTGILGGNECVMYFLYLYVIVFYWLWKQISLWDNNSKCNLTASSNFRKWYFWLFWPPLKKAIFQFLDMLVTWLFGRQCQSATWFTRLVRTEICHQPLKKLSLNFVQTFSRGYWAYWALDFLSSATVKLALCF